ncbi:MAG TPA: aspartyl/asparaginyl beta-hydroxylase domain-containing protein [Gammaproteobacteria bacterium]|nr:aspartyl/asparaginyl beta-hydroxylase domain-containing protein [Gammaproteobacteria bacterium]
MRYDVAAAVAQIDANPSAWNRHRDRTVREGPHACVDDIWVRFNPIGNMADDPVAFFRGEHVSEWYPVADEIPAARALAKQVFADVGGTRLGGVLITRVPAGGKVLPHVDSGWHAGYYEKFAVQLRGNEQQTFHFENSSLSALPGESYTFDNSKLHWVTNDSDEDRMTLIVCIRRDNPMLRREEHIPFDMYFASIASMQVHPGAGTKEHRKMTLEECCHMALQMLDIRRSVISGEEN